MEQTQEQNFNTEEREVLRSIHIDLNADGTITISETPDSEGRLLDHGVKLEILANIGNQCQQELNMMRLINTLVNTDAISNKISETVVAKLSELNASNEKTNITKFKK